jgi:hypothetical protein
MIKRRSWPGAAVIVLLCFLGFLLGACGKKAPPKPPVKKELPRVNDLQAVVEASGVRLTWTIGTASKDVVGFNVYRSKPRPEVSDCPGCTRDFELITSVKVKTKESRFQVVDPYIEGKGRFYYQVVPFDQRDRTGPDSNEARVLVE